MKIYFDACAFIRAIESSDPISAILRRLMFSPNENPSLEVITSVITYAEIQSKPAARLRSNPDDEDAKRVNDLYFWLMIPYFFLDFSILNSKSPIICADVTIDTSAKAANLRSQHASLKTPDALHIATAIERGCDAVISNDDDFLKVAAANGLPGVPFVAADLDALLARISAAP